MSNLISDYVKNSLGESDDGVKEEGKDVRFTVAVKPSLMRRMEFMIDKIGKSKSAFAADAIDLLVSEFEMKLGFLKIEAAEDFGIAGEGNLMGWDDEYAKKIIWPTEKDFKEETGLTVKYVDKGSEEAKELIRKQQSGRDVE